MSYRTVLTSVSVSHDELEYAREVARKESVAAGRRVSVSEVFRRALRALRKVRHDLPGQANTLELIAELRERKAIKPREVVAEIRAVAKKLGEARDEVGASSPAARTPAAPP